MSLRNTCRFLAFAAATVAALSVGTPAGATPPASDPPVSQPPTTEAPGAESEDPLGASADEQGIVHSWALAPAGNGEQGGNRPNLSYSGAPGDVIEDAITLYNLGTEDLPFRVYSTDAYNDEDGAFTLLVGDEVPSDAGSWITLDAEEIVVPAGKQATIPFTLTIPEGAAPGDHAGAVLASSPTVGRGQQNEVITLDRRTGTRLFVRVSGPLEPLLSVERLSTDYSGSANPLAGSATVTYRIENRGNVRLNGTAETSVSGPFGLGRQAAPPQAFEELLPGEGFDVTVALDDVPALVSLNSEVTLTDLSGGDGEPLDDVQRSARSLALPVAVLLILLLAILAALSVRMVRRHRQQPASMPPSSAPVRELESLG